MYLYMQVHGQKKALPCRQFDSICSKLSHQCRALIPKKLLRPSLSLSPRRTDSIQQVTTLDRNLYWQAPAVLSIGNLLDPTIGQHDLQIPGQCGWVEVQTLPNFDAPNGASLCHKNQKIRLACFQAEWTEFSVVDTREHTIKFAHAHQQALLRDLINDFVPVIYPFMCFRFSHGIILHIQIDLVKPPPEIIFYPLLLFLFKYLEVDFSMA